MKRISWDAYFMTMVYFVAMRSKDESSHLGAVIVGANNEVRSTGYNSFPRGIFDDDNARQQRPEKYFWFEHAERNAIYNAARMGTSTEGCKMYTQGVPCTDCARGIINSGIKEVIYHKAWNDENPEHWQKHADRSIVMFNEARITLHSLDIPLVQIYAMWNGKILDLEFEHVS